MDYLRRTFNSFTVRMLNRGGLTSRAPERPVVEFSKMDAYLNFVHKILVWEDPTSSWAALVIVNFLFWLIVYMELRLLGIVFSTLLILFITDLYFEQSGLKAQRTPSSDTVREAIHFCRDIVLYLRTLRKDNASMFCGIMCTVFLTLSFVARSINGYLLSYMFIIGLFFGPVLFSKLPPEYVKHIKSGLKVIATNEGMLAEKELIPFLSEKEDDADSLVSEKTVDSVSTSLISGITSMPSYLEVEGSVDGLDEEDLDISPTNQTVLLNKAVDEYSSDSDSSELNLLRQQIQFDSGHFKPDNSTDDENSSSSNSSSSYSKGLSFTDAVDSSADVVRTKATLVQNLGAGIMSNISTVGASLLSSVMMNAPLQTRQETSESGKKQSVAIRRDSSDNSGSSSDFEIINDDELNATT